ncbi:hypothetical protein CVT26_004146 [Gymnopilus dilepis]|uniref:Uncharacterized protein n=1 Tax=Gymnopilus dilepis TaxID=231916 RepID=A0A409X7T0_9AGAR|nr:hypothetical protein CVT26_004146 [Gymnopilus dilepis]
MAGETGEEQRLTLGLEDGMPFDSPGGRASCLERLQRTSDFVSMRRAQLLVKLVVEATSVEGNID